MGIFDNLAQKSSDRPEANSADASPPPDKKVLIVEDEPALADALAVKFKHEGFAAIKAENGQVGLEKAVAEKPNIILLDLMMPIMDGKTMLKRLRDMTDFKNTPVLILTNAGDVDNIRETQLYYNASGFLIKSNVSPDEIVAKVKDLT